MGRVLEDASACAAGAAATASRSRWSNRCKQDRGTHITRFEQEFVEGRGQDARRGKKFTLAFRTLSVPQMVRRLEKAGFEVSALLGDYQGGPWDLRAEVWIILARRG